MTSSLFPLLLGQSFQTITWIGLRNIFPKQTILLHWKLSTLAQNTHICAKQFLVLQLSFRDHSHNLSFQVSTFIKLKKKSKYLLLSELYRQQSLYFNTNANDYSTTDMQSQTRSKNIFFFSSKPQIPNSSGQDLHLVSKTLTSLPKLLWQKHFLLWFSYNIRN